MATINTQSLKYDIINNFIDYFSSNEEERDRMRIVAKDYVNQDHVDEIGQSLLPTSKNAGEPTYSIIALPIVAPLSNVQDII